MMKRRRGLFLDRDGVVNVDTDFVFQPEKFVFQPGIFDLVASARDRGYVPVVVTNQSGLARGFFTEDDFHNLTAWMLQRFAAEGCPIEKVYHCPYLPAATVEKFRHPDHPWRKPRPGMLLAARDDFDLDLENSAMVGDRWSDAAAARAAGLRNIVLVGGRADREKLPSVAGVYRVTGVSDCPSWLLSLDDIDPQADDERIVLDAITAHAAETESP